MTYPVNIVYLVVDEYNLTMYKEDGETITVPQGDPRIKHIVARAVPVIDGGGWYSLTEEDMSGKNHYAEVEKSSNGLVRFFKMAKSKLKEIAEKFCEPVKPLVSGHKPQPPMAHEVEGEKFDAVAIVEQIVQDTAPALPPEEQRPLTKSEAAVAEIMANARPSNERDFSTVRTADQAKTTGEEEETIVAVLGDNTVIHGVEQLEGQMAAVTAGVTSVDGMQRFLNRAATVKRGHSVEDLLKFVQKGELPFADDGTVLVYKRLQSSADGETFVDCHSKKVKQRIGSFVHMAEHMVDPNRSQDCSNGLHVARRDYLSSFNGDVVVLCKLAPEDVIAVPQYDARKLRAKGYHIIARLSQEDANRVCRNEPMKDTVLLANAIAGNHPPILEYVEITEGYGGGLKIRAAGEVAQQAAAPVREVSSLDHVAEATEAPQYVDSRELALGLANKPKDEQVFHAPPAQMNVTSEPVAPAATAPIPVPPPADFKPGKGKSPAQLKVDAFVNADVPSTKLAAARDLLAFKKAAKKSWTALNIPATVWTKAQEIVEATQAVPAKPATPILDGDNSGLPDKPIKVKQAAPKKAPAKPQTKSAAIDRKAEAQRAADNHVKKEKKMTQQEEMAKLVKLYEANPDKANARAIFAFKQKSKKSWETLGVDDEAFQKKITERAKL